MTSCGALGRSYVREDRPVQYSAPSHKSTTFIVLLLQNIAITIHKQTSLKNPGRPSVEAQFDGKYR